MRRTPLALFAAGLLGLAGAADPPRPAAPDTRFGKALRQHQKKIDDLTRQHDDAIAKEKEAVAQKVAKMVRDYPQDPGVAVGVKFLLDAGTDEQIEAALGVVADKLVGSDTLAELCPDLARSRSLKAEEVLRKLAADSPHRAVRGAAHLHLGERLTDAVEEADGVERADRLYADAEKHLTAATGYPDVPDPAAGRAGPVSDAAKGLLAGLAVARKLHVGRPAPDAAVRLGARVVKLSDLKGRVVVVKFGAAWCPTCRAMKPHQLELERRLAGKACTYLDVDVDRNPALAEGWGVVRVPRVFVLDAKGVIRFKGVRGDDLDRAVDALLAEAGR